MPNWRFYREFNNFIVLHDKVHCKAQNPNVKWKNFENKQQAN